MIHRIEIIWEKAMFQEEERAASLIRAPPKYTLSTEQF